MVVYRVVNLKFAKSVLTGKGAEKVGGRWNEVGTRAVYCSENIALALLEYYVHSENVAYLPSVIAVAEIKIPDEFVINELERLPEDWNQYPYSANTTGVFSNLTKNRDFFALKVPSTIVPFEYNFILNPLYKDFGRVEIIKFLNLSIDDRLKSGVH